MFITPLQTKMVLFLPFQSESHLTASSMISSMVLKSSGEKEHLCLVLDLNGNASGFSLLSTVLAVL